MSLGAQESYLETTTGVFWARIVACDPGEVSGPKYPYVGRYVW